MSFWARRGIQIAYAPDAVILDEKVASSDVFVRQRRRWLAAQWHYARMHALPALATLVRTGNVDYADKALQMLLLPRAVLLALSPVLFGVAGLVGASVLPWAGLCGALAVAIGLGIPADLRRGLLGDLLHLPRALALMGWALAKSRGANRTFLHTPHTAATAARP